MLRAERITPAGPPPAAAPAVSPLTHHEILRLAEPFSRSGRAVDLPASDRMARQLAFRPRQHAAGDSLPALREDLVLDAAGSGSWFSLQRLLQVMPGRDASHAPLRTDSATPAPAGQQASLQAEGSQPDRLLAWVDAMPAARQWQEAAGVRIALGHKLLAPGRGQAEPVLSLVRASASLAGLAVEMTVSRVKNVPAELLLRPASGSSGAAAGAAVAGPAASVDAGTHAELAQDPGMGRRADRSGASAAHRAAAPASLPEDLLAVLGLDWSRLSRHSGGWRASLRLRGEGAARALDAEAKFRRTIEHLVRVLTAAPAAFHDRFRAARWRVSLRRGFPLLVCTALIGASAAVPLLELGPGSVYRMLIFNAPPLLMVWLFAMRELPRIEWPPLPRPLAADAWTPAGSTDPNAR